MICTFAIIAEERSSKVSQADTRAKPNEIIHPIKQEYSSTESGCDYGKNTMTEVAPRQFESVGQTPREGMPLVLRSVSILLQVSHIEYLSFDIYIQ